MKDPSGSAFASAPRRLTRRIRQRKQPVQRRSQETTEAIVTATLQVLRKDGYRHLTTTRVADRAGVSVGTLYQYFPDKQSLVVALQVRYFSLMIGAVRDAITGNTSDSLGHLLHRALEALLHVKRENLELTLALRTPMSERDGGNFVRESLENFEAALMPAVTRALPRLPHAECRLTIAVAALEGAISHAVFEAPDWLLEEWFLDDLVALATGFLEGAVSR
jgi:AcrR family transcriptional regulator